MLHCLPRCVRSLPILSVSSSSIISFITFFHHFPKHVFIHSLKSCSKQLKELVNWPKPYPASIMMLCGPPCTAFLVRMILSFHPPNVITFLKLIITDLRTHPLPSSRNPSSSHPHEISFPRMRADVVLGDKEGTQRVSRRITCKYR